jgi:DNA-binding CsgD family transcriptional regulator
MIRSLEVVLPGSPVNVRSAGYKQQMGDEELEQAVRRLRAEGHAPKEIARALGVRPAAVAPLVRLIAAERTAAETERELAGCWVSPGWRVGLTVLDHHEWPDGETADPETGGLVGVLLAREDRNQQVTVCGYLLDVYCLGVKNVLGPERMRRGELSSFSRSFFCAWASGGVPAPIELARELVLGVAEYACTLGFRPHADFEQARGHLGWSGHDPLWLRRNADLHRRSLRRPRRGSAHVGRISRSRELPLHRIRRLTRRRIDRLTGNTVGCDGAG